MLFFFTILTPKIQQATVFFVCSAKILFLISKQETDSNVFCLANKFFETVIK